ncbi:MAG TPA: glycine betaine ABC transporter substrate-binding protein [Micromonosporaceae bacterium]
MALASFLAGCGSSGSSGTKPVAKASGTGCAPIAGTQLVTLADDKHLQLSDVVIPIWTTQVNKPPLANALNKVSSVLDQTALNGMNKAVSVDRQTPAQAAAAFAKSAGLDSGIGGGGSGKIAVVYADFGEDHEMAELYKIVLDEAGYQASTQAVSTRELYLPLLKQNKVQVVPDYAASLTTALYQGATKKTDNGPVGGDISTTLAGLKQYAPGANLVVGTPSTATDVNAFAVTAATAQKYGLKTLSDFAAKCSGKATTLAGPAECPTRPFCEEGLQQTYKISFGGFVNMGTDAGGPVTKKALTDGKATLGLVFSSDPTVSAAS